MRSSIQPPHKQSYLSLFPKDLEQINWYGFQTIRESSPWSQCTEPITILMLQAPSEAQWKGLWKIKTTDRIKILLWKMATNSLPTRDILHQRFENINSSCALCGSDLESKCHLFFTCLIARAIWFETCWGFRTDSQHVQCRESWKPPSPGFIKLNVDAAANLSRTALAVVARNSFDEVIKVWAKPHHSCPPIQTEASAIQWAVNLASRERWNQVLMKSDSKVCMDSLSDNPSVPNWAISNDIFNILNSALSFLCCSFVWARRSCNVAAHIAAKLALSLASPLCFNEENLPEVILSACVVDSSNVDSSFSVEWYWSLGKKKKKSQTLI